ncbi:unnamed protein product [Peniophora sp. CBMAI 1063]|nr:unnamed protein product [Peniophora sp. CBMAI 1063]
MRVVDSSDGEMFDAGTPFSAEYSDTGSIGEPGEAVEGLHIPDQPAITTELEQKIQQLRTEKLELEWQLRHEREQRELRDERRRQIAEARRQPSTDSSPHSSREQADDEVSPQALIDRPLVPVEPDADASTDVGSES